MVDVAAILAEFFGPDDTTKGLSGNGCVRCVGVLDGVKPLKNQENPNTPYDEKRHTSNQGVFNSGAGCVRDIVEYQHVTSKDTPTHRAHLKNNNPKQPAADDGPQHDLVARWAAEIERLARLQVASPDAAKALKSARAFIADGWALQAARLGWDEVELFGVCPNAPWARFDRKGGAYFGNVVALTVHSISYTGGLTRHRAQINNDHGAVVIWAPVLGDPDDPHDRLLDPHDPQAWA